VVNARGEQVNMTWPSANLRGLVMDGATQAGCTQDYAVGLQASS
jgi:hypothetical protein